MATHAIKFVTTYQVLFSVIVSMDFFFFLLITSLAHVCQLSRNFDRYVQVIVLLQLKKYV